MNDNQLYVKLIAFLGAKADAIVSQAQATLCTSYGFNEDSESWWHSLKKNTFLQAIFAGLVACVFIGAWRIIATVMEGQADHFVLLAFATVIAETINESVMVFRFSVTSAHLTEKRSKWSNFSVMGLMRFISHLFFGRELPILYYLLFYLIVVGIAFSLEYELGLIGVWEKIYHILFALLPTIGIAVLSHYLGEQVREAKAHDKGQFSKVWEAEKLTWLVDTLEAKAAGGTAYAMKALEFYHYLINGSDGLGSQSVQGLELKGFARIGYLNSTEQPRTAKNVGTYRTDDIDAAKRVISAYPDVNIDASGWHTRISEVTGYKRGSSTTRIFEAMKYIDAQGDDNA